MTPSEQSPASIRVEGGMCVIRLPVADVHGLRVALAPCPCKATKSNETADIRERLAKGLGRISSQAPAKDYQR